MFITGPLLTGAGAETFTTTTLESPSTTGGLEELMV